jgi:hypothetical protein
MNCSICQDKIQSTKHNCVSTKCGHHFHCDCFLEFLQKNRGENLCPICRKKIPFHKNTFKKMSNQLAIDMIFELFHDLDFEDYWNTSNLADDQSIIRGYVINLMRSVVTSVQKFYEGDNNDESEYEESVYEESVNEESVYEENVNEENVNEESIYEINDGNQNINEIVFENNLQIEENGHKQEQFSQILDQEAIEDMNSIHSILHIYHALSIPYPTRSRKEKID